MGFNLFGLGKKIEDILGGVGNQANRFFGGAQNQFQNIVREAPQQTQNIWNQGQRAVNSFVQQQPRIQAPQLPRVDFSKLSQDMNMPRIQVNQRALDQNKAISDFATGATKWAVDHTVKPIWDEAYKTQAAISNKYENPNAPTLMDRVRKEGVLGGIRTQAQKTVAPTVDFGSAMLEKGIQSSPVGSIARETLRPIAWATGGVDNPVTNYLTGGPMGRPEMTPAGIGKEYLAGALDRANIAGGIYAAAKPGEVNPRAFHYDETGRVVQGEPSYFGPPRTKPGEVISTQISDSSGKPFNVTGRVNEPNVYGRLLNKVGVKTPQSGQLVDMTPAQANRMGLARVIPTTTTQLDRAVVPEATSIMNVPRVVPTAPVVQPPTQPLTPPTGVQVKPTVVNPTAPTVTPPSTTVSLPAPTPINIPNVSPGVIPPEMNPTGVVKVGDKYTITDTVTGKKLTYNTAREAQDALVKMPKYPTQEQITTLPQETPKPQFLSEKSGKLETLNPTGGLYVEYTPKTRATMPLGDNIKTLAHTTGKSPDEMITIYRGAPANQKGINPGDFITTDPELARTYAGIGNVISKKVRLGDVLDDVTEPGGGEYIYRPKADKQLISSNNQAVPQIRPKPQVETPAITPEVARAAGGTPPPESPVPPPAKGEPTPQFDPSKTKSGAFTQVKKAFSDSDQVILDTLRDIEKRTGQKGLVKKFMYDSNMVRASNAGADVHITGSQGFNDALKGLSKKEYKLFSEYANARTELSTADKMVKTSQSPEDLAAIVQAGDAKFGKRFEALNQHYKDLASVLHKAGVISDETLADYVKNNDYIRIQRDMGDLVPPNTGKTKSRSLGSTVTSQKRKGSGKAVLPAGETAADFTQTVYREAAKNIAGTNLIDILLKDGQAKKLVDAEDVKFRKDMYKFLAETKQAPIKKVNEYSDTNVRNSLQDTADKLGIDVKRVLDNRGNWIGRSHTGQNIVELKAGAPERVMIHEIGHQLDEKFGIQDAVLGTGRSLPEKTLNAQIKRATESGDKQLASSLEKQKKLNKEVRKLAALRHEGIEPSKSFSNYVRKSEEKVAVMFEAYLHAPQRFRAIAPNLYKEFKGFLNSHEETTAIANVKPSLLINKNVVQSRPDNPELDAARRAAYNAARQRADLSTKNKNTVSIFRNGIKETYEVSRDMKEAIDNVNPYTMNVVMQVLAAPGRVFRAGVTGLNPVFIVRNVVKDQAGSFINSENVMATHNPVSIWKGLWGATKNSVGTNNDPLFQDFLRHYGNQTSYDLTRNSQNAAQLVNRTRGGKIVGLGQAIKSPIRSLENLASITEISTRFQNYRGEYVKAIKQGLPKEAASERAAIAAWQNSVDFSRAGTWGRAINTVIPYWNPSTQGVRQMVRSSAAHPVNTLFKAFLVIGAPLLAATIWNNSSEDTKKVWNNIPQYDKENNIILIPPGTTQNQDGTYDVIKIPMSPGWKDPFVAMARAYDAYANDKPQDAVAMGIDVLNALTGPLNIRTPEQLIGSVTPQLIKPMVQQAMNKDLFTGQQIISDYINNATDANGNPIPESQKAYPNGSGSADIIGSKLGVSPIRVEKFIKDTGGTVGLNLQNAADRTLASMGVIDQNKIGGQSIAEGFAKSFEKSRGIVNENATPGQKYYQTIKEVTSNMTGNEKSAFQALHPDKKNFLGDIIYENDSTYNPAARLDIYNRFPKVFEADKQLDAKGRAEGRPGNPLFDLTPQQVKKVLEKENLPPGAKDPELSNLYSQDWYAEYKNKKTQYFSGIKESQKKDLAAAIASGDTKSVEAIQNSINKFSTQDNPYPDTSPELQKVMDYYNNLPKGTGARSQWIRSNPGLFDAMKQQWAAVDNWQNIARGKRGLAATEGDAGKANGYGTSTSNSYSSGGGSKKPNLYGTGDPYKYIVSGGEAGFSNTRAKARKAKPLAKARVRQQPKVSVRKSMV